MIKPLNTIPIENFLDKTRISIKSNQKTVTLTIQEATDLANSLAVAMTRLNGQLEQVLTQTQTVVQPTQQSGTFDGGTF